MPKSCRKIADTYVCIYPNAGLPNPMSDTGFDETPDVTSSLLQEFADSRLRQHRRRLLRHHARPYRARSPSREDDRAAQAAATCRRRMRLSGLEPFAIDEDSLFVNVGERTNVTGSKAFARLILNEQYDEALSVARQQVENGAQIIDINMDEAMLDSEAAMTRFLNLIASEPDIARVPIMIDSSKWTRDRSRPEMRAGQGHRQLDLDEGRRRGVPAPGDAVPALRRRGDRDGLRRSRARPTPSSARSRSASAPTSC